MNLKSIIDKIILIDKEMLAKKIVFFAIIFSAVMNFVFPLFHIPSFFKGVFIVLDILFLLYVIINIKKIMSVKYLKWMFIIAVLFFAVSLIGLCVNGTSIPLFFVGFRNTFRYFIFFFCVCLILSDDDIFKIIKITDILFYINIVAAIIEIIFLKYNRDYISGTFALGIKGGNAGLIMLFIIQLSLLFNRFLSNKISIIKFIILLSVTLGLAAIAELKIIFVIFAIIVVISIILNKKSKKTYYIVGIGLVLLLLSVKILTSIFPEWKDTFSISGIYNNIFGNEFGYSTKYDISRGRAFTQIDEMFYNDKPINRLVGFGIGNCDSFKYLKITSPFYEKYENLLHYDWFTHSMVYLETGLLGFVLFLSFFVANLINNIIFLKRIKKNNKRINMLLYSTLCFSLVCIISIWYDSFLRLDYAYFAYAFLAIPYLCINKYKDNISK